MLLLNHTCDIYRMQAIGDSTTRKSMQLLTSGVRCLGLPLGANVTIQNEMQLGRAYQFNFAPGTDVQVGDRLLWNGAKVSVKYVRPYVNTPPVSHIEVMCEQEVA